MTDAAAPVPTTFDDCWAALARAARRRCLVALLDADERPVDPAWCQSSTGDPVIALYHVHLPKLADAGFIEWDTERDVVRPGPDYDQIRPVLELLRRNEGDLPVCLL